MSTSMLTPAKDAATVMILRDNPTTGQINVYVQQRTSTMAYAPNSVVFPGGGVDDIDRDIVANRLGNAIDKSAIRAAEADLVGQQAHQVAVSRVAARREVHEETGVDISTRTLHLVDRWIAPPHHLLNRRYDVTTFALGFDGDPADFSLTTTEATYSYWANPRQLLVDFAYGDIRLLPPTWFHMRELSKFDTVAQALAHLSVTSPTKADRRRVYPNWVLTDPEMRPYFRLATVDGSPI